MVQCIQLPQMNVRPTEATFALTLMSSMPYILIPLDGMYP
jgi:hypothetical protein